MYNFFSTKPFPFFFYSSSKNFLSPNNPGYFFARFGQYFFSLVAYKSERKKFDCIFRSRVYGCHHIVKKPQSLSFHFVASLFQRVLPVCCCGCIHTESVHNIYVSFCGFEFNVRVGGYCGYSGTRPRDDDDAVALYPLLFVCVCGSFH